MKAALVVAAADNDVIGLDGGLPWRAPADLANFRRLTLSHAIVMGRRTNDSIKTALGGQLPHRRTFVLSRRGTPNLGADERVVADLDQAMSAADAYRADAGQEEFFVAGGLEVYVQALPLVRRIYLTRVHLSPEGETSMPPGWLAGFACTDSRELGGPAEKVRCTFMVYDRAGAGDGAL